MSDKTKTKSVVAIIGATGYTGRFVIAELLRRGMTPIAIARDANALSAANFPENEVYRRQASLNDAVSLDRALHEAQAVINCAGPFVDTADAVVSAALRAGIHYVDVEQKQANDAMVKGIVAQQAQIRADAATLERLQSQASTADGQMKALYAANQLAALQQEQLLQIRALLVQEQQALAARGQTLANDEAMREAATKKFFDVPLITVNHTGWAP